MKKRAVILFNLGGPDRPESVKPFLFNLFNDKAIISAPNPIRFLLAKLISGRREEIAKEIYSFLGGKSPIMEETTAQAEKLENSLNKKSDDKYRVFISMRYWHPFSHDIIEDVKKYNPDEVILLPLYPQFSTATTQSSIDDWVKTARKYDLDKPTATICCYPFEENFINSHVALIEKELAKIDDIANYRVLFSAHGLPEKIIKKGDPYQWQVEEGAKKIAEQLNIENLDWNVCYQSRVGPLKWIGPSTEDEIERASDDKKNIILVPVAFVSEHSETLVELDIEYKEVADEKNIEKYIRIPTLSIEKNYIKSLSDIVLDIDEDNFGKICPNGKNKLCPSKFNQCPSNFSDVSNVDDVNNICNISDVVSG